MLESYKKTAANLQTIKVSYSKSQLYPNSTDQLRPGQSIRIVFKGSETGNFDLANTTLNFLLEIDRFENPTRNPLVLSNSAADLFEVQNIQWQGIEMKHLRQRGGDQVFRKIKYMLGYNKHEISDHQQKYMDLQVPFGGSAVVDGDTGILPKALRTYSQSPGVYISEIENARLENEVRRHYTFSADGSDILPQFAKRADLTQKFYSVKIKDLCPELQDFTYVDASMLAGSGIEIQMLLVNPDICMTLLSRAQGSTALSANANKYYFNAMDKYTISNHYLTIPTHEKQNNLAPLGFGLNNPMSYITFGHQLFSVAGYQMSQQWSIQHPSYCLGTMLLFTNSTLRTTPQTVEPGKEMNMSLNIDSVTDAESAATDYNCRFRADKLGYFSTNYMYPIQFSEMNLSVGNDTYHKQSGPPIANRGLSSWVAANDACLQMWGKFYNTTLERFLTIDHVIFIPVQKKLVQGELFQLNLTMDPNQKHGANLLCHAITVVTNTASFSSNGFKIE